MEIAFHTLTGICLALALTAASAADAAKPAPAHGKAAPKGRLRPLICAHRGASAAAPENTLAAFVAARELGADSFELDVDLTSDGVPVLLHDGTLDRTTDGTGPVAKMTYAEVKRLDAGSWKDPKFAGEPLPTLEDALRTRGSLYVNIELKAGGGKIDEIAEKAVRLIEKYRAEKAVIISSFSREALEAVKRFNPRVRTGFLYFGKTPDTMPAGIDAVHPHFATVNAEYMEWARAKGYQVNVWTVNDPKEMTRLMDLGVDSIITDVPSVMHEVRAAR